MNQPNIEILNASLHVYLNGESMLVDKGGFHYLPSTGVEFHMDWPETLDMIKSWHKVNDLIKGNDQDNSRLLF